MAPYLDMKTILITGSLGLVGSAAVKLFKEKGWQVIGIDTNNRARFFGTDPQEDEEYIDIDIRNSVEINDLFEEVQPDAVIHAAAQPSHDYATDHVIEDFSINALGTLYLLEAARHYAPEAPFVYVSTDKVYGQNMDCDLVENETRYLGGIFNEQLGLDFAGDRSFFGCSKAAGDMYAQQYAARFGMKIGIFRPGCITGKNHQGAEQHGFLAYLAKCIKEGKSYTIYGNGKQVRDQIHAADICAAFGEFIAAPRAGAVYNIGGGRERSVSVLEAAKLIEEATGKPFIHEFKEARKGDRLWDVHDVRRFRADYPAWQYTFTLSDIIHELCAS